MTKKKQTIVRTNFRPPAEFMGLRAPVTVGRGLDQPGRSETYVLDFEQVMNGITPGENKTWRLFCVQCQRAEGGKRPPWQTDTFTTGANLRDCPEEEQQHQYERVLEQVHEHVALHERLATWYESLAESPVYKKGVGDEMMRGVARE
jgi:hypothetical protein